MIYVASAVWAPAPPERAATYVTYNPTKPPEWSLGSPKKGRTEPTINRTNHRPTWPTLLRSFSCR